MWKKFEKSLWKKLKESEKNYQNIRKTLAIPRIIGHPFYHTKRFWKAALTMKHTDNNKKTPNFSQ